MSLPAYSASKPPLSGRKFPGRVRRSTSEKDVKDTNFARKAILKSLHMSGYEQWESSLAASRESANSTDNRQEISEPSPESSNSKDGEAGSEPIQDCADLLKSSDLKPMKEPWSLSPLQEASGYTEIPLRMLEVGILHENRVVCGDLFVKPYIERLHPDFHKFAVRTVLEDDMGAAVSVMICGVVDSLEYPPRDLEEIFPDGLKVAIKDPRLVKDVDQKPALLVLKPADICLLRDFICESGATISFDNVQRRQYLDYSDDPTALIPQSPILRLKSEESEQANVQDFLGEVLRLGDNVYKSKDWAGAATIYSDCINLIYQRKDACSSAYEVLSNFGDLWGSVFTENTKKAVADENNRLENLLSGVFLKNCRSMMQAGKYENALMPAELSVRLGLQQWNSINHKACALLSLGRFQEAFDSFEAARNLLPKHYADSQNEEPSSRENDENPNDSQPGSSSRPQIPSGLGALPIFKEYVSPALKIQPIYASGRGLVLTADVQAGNTLIVSDGLIVIRDMKIQTGNQWVDEINRELVRKLAGRIKYSSEMRKQIYNLDDGSGSERAPPISLYTPNQALQNQRLQYVRGIDMERLRCIVQINAINETGFQQTESTSYSVHGIQRGLWLLPSFINHSCIPNCNRMRIGNNLFIVASRDISAGDEVTIPYFEIFKDLKTRRNSAEGMGFICWCPRCSFEADLEDRASKSPHQKAIGFDPQAPPELNMLRKQWVVASSMGLYVEFIKEFLPKTASVEAVLDFMYPVLNTVSIVHPGNVLGLRLSTIVLGFLKSHYGDESEEYIRREGELLQFYTAFFGNRGKEFLLEMAGLHTLK